MIFIAVKFCFFSIFYFKSCTSRFNVNLFRKRNVREKITAWNLNYQLLKADDDLYTSAVILFYPLFEVRCAIP